LPLSWKVGLSFHGEGVWSDHGFVAYANIDGLSWREGERLTWILIRRVRNLVRSPDIPLEHYGEWLDLGTDERELV
jgi:hypothetical protein